MEEGGVLPRVRVEWVAGRTEAQRQEVAKRITDALVEAGGATYEAVGVVFEDVPASHYYKGGAQWSLRQAQAATADREPS